MILPRTAEVADAFRTAWAQIGANKLRSILTASGVIIGIVAVTLMGAAIRGVDLQFESTIASMGHDVLYVDRIPWFAGGDRNAFRNRPALKADYAEQINTIIAGAGSSLLELAVPVCQRSGSAGLTGSTASSVPILGTVPDYVRTSTLDVGEGRFFSATEAYVGRDVCVIGHELARSLFPDSPAVGQTIQVINHPFAIVGVFAKQGTFAEGYADSYVVVPLGAFRRYFDRGQETSIYVKIRDPQPSENAVEELVGIMRRLRGLGPEQKEDFSIDLAQAYADRVGPVRGRIAFGGLFITGLALFVGAIGIMNITFVSAKERTKEIGTRRALGARRRVILLQFLVEATTVSVVGGAAGSALAFGAFLWIRVHAPSFPMGFPVSLVLAGVLVSAATGILAGFAPAWSASRLDPAAALRYE